MTADDRKKSECVADPDWPDGPVRLVVSPEAFEAFARLIDDPPEPNAGLRRLLAATPIWDR